MDKVNYFNAQDFFLDSLISEKGNRKIYIVFSTFGEREAELIYNKIQLLKNETDDLIDMIFLSHRREGREMDLTEKKALEADEKTEIILCNSLAVPDMDNEKGKGADMRRSLYYINKNYKNDVPEDDIIIVFLDADVVTEHFGSHFVLGLAGSILRGYEFSKASFWREMGRVKKYVAQPLFSIIDHPDVKKLTSFSYPLSGEVAGTLAFFNRVNFWQIYGVETGINIDSCFGDFRVADVNLGLYDHEHHPDLNIQKMSFGIIRTFFKQMIDYGVISLNDNAGLSDIFQCSYIDKDAKRQFLEFDLTELKYNPLKEIL